MIAVTAFLVNWAISQNSAATKRDNTWKVRGMMALSRLVTLALQTTTRHSQCRSMLLSYDPCFRPPLLFGKTQVEKLKLRLSSVTKVC